MHTKIVSVVALAALLILIGFATRQAAFAAPSGFADPLFETKWSSTDEAVANGSAGYSWVYGPKPGASPQEAYTEAPGGQRLVQYFDKARMEKTNRLSNPNLVTAGNLTTELVSGQQQNGDATFTPKTLADVPVAGDGNDPDGPTYASFQSVATVPGAAHPASQNISEITDTISRAGVVSPFIGTRPVVARNAYFINETKHNIPDVFFTWLTTKAPGNWIDIVGFPIAEAYWATVKVGGVPKVVLMQLYERRVLTFTASNSPQYQVEYGNIGQHYYTWRYGATTYNPNGIWRGKTTQNKSVFFTVDNGAVSTFLFFFTLAGCDQDVFGTTLRSPRTIGSDKSFAILGQTQDGTTIEVDGTIDSSTTATINLSIVFGNANPKCKGTVIATGTLTKDPLSPDTSRDGTWLGTSTLNSKPVAFEVVHHTIRSFSIPYLDKSNCIILANGFESAFFDYDHPGNIKDDNTFAISDGGTAFTYNFAGALPTATSATGNFRITANFPALSQYAPCNGQATGTFTATKQSTTQTALAIGAVVWTSGYRSATMNTLSK